MKLGFFVPKRRIGLKAEIKVGWKTVGLANLEPTVFYMDWLTKDLKLEVKRIFETRYKRKLSNEEIIEIACNLTNFVENFTRYKYGKEKND